MSSVTRFLKQHDVSQSYLSAPTRTLLLEFVPAVAGSTGNYPDGYVRAVQDPVLTAILAQTAGAPGFILRDMGKTIKARNAQTTGDYGYFRQVQLLAPRGLTAAGAPVSATVGVMGEAAYNYFTLYVPAPVAGILALAPIAGVSPLVGGQL
jgi:hypothetical protein